MCHVYNNKQGALSLNIKGVSQAFLATSGAAIFNAGFYNSLVVWLTSLVDGLQVQCFFVPSQEYGDCRQSELNCQGVVFCKQLTTPEHSSLPGYAGLLLH
jgi:hypothetical protein